MIIDVESELADAVSQFWRVRRLQTRRQGRVTGKKDAGNRSAVTAGKHADGFVRLVASIVTNAGLTHASVYTRGKYTRTLPGFFRPMKEWDVVVSAGSNLVAVVEIKSQVGSFGNNFNNRVEEALGNATDFWAAYMHGMYKPTVRPWLGYLFMLEASATSLAATKHVALQPYPVDHAFERLSYAARYELACLRLVRERLYDAACLVLSDAKAGLRGGFEQPNPELGIRSFAAMLHARAAAFAAYA